jgi:putative glutamine amidotransferase
MVTLEYQEAISSAGGIPIIASPYALPEDLIEFSDGWLITGGDDIPGEIYGQITHPKAKLAHPLRYPFEKSLFDAFYATGKPVLGICFGSQFLAVVTGGNLIQHLPETLGNSIHSEGINLVSARGRLARIVGEEPFEVKCFHHQGIETVGADWAISARAADGCAEAIEHDSRWIFGVQWHPERTANSPPSIALFSAFVQEATHRR